MSAVFESLPGIAGIAAVQSINRVIDRSLFNVPLTQRLDTLLPASAEAVQFWKTTYLPRWVLWNTVRSTACVTSAGLFLKAWALGAGY